MSPAAPAQDPAASEKGEPRKRAAPKSARTPAKTTRHAVKADDRASQSAHESREPAESAHAAQESELTNGGTSRSADDAQNQESPEPAAPATRRKPAASRARNPSRPPRKPGPGKDSALTLTRLNSITNVIAAGNYITTACQFAGIGEGTFHRWRARGEVEVDRVACLPRTNVDRIMEGFEGKDPRSPDGNGNPMDKASADWMWTHRPRQFEAVEWPYVIFQFQVERARAAAEIRTIQSIHKAAGTGSWQAGAWWLERTMPEKYGRRDHLNLEGSKAGDPIRTEAIVTVDVLNKKLAALLDD